MHLLYSLLGSMALARLNGRLVAVEGRKLSLSLDLGLDADGSPNDVMSLAWLRYQYSMNRAPTTVWGQMNGYLLYGVLEYIVQYRDRTEGRADGVIDAIWDFIETSRGVDPYLSLCNALEQRQQGFGAMTKKEKLVAAVQVFQTLGIPTPGLEGVKDADFLITKIVVSIMKRGTISGHLLTKLNQDLTNDKSVWSTRNLVKIS